MPAYHPARAVDTVGRPTDPLPLASVIIGGLVIIACIFYAAGLTWPPPSRPTHAMPTIAITPDDPAAPTPVPVQDLGR